MYLFTEIPQTIVYIYTGADKGSFTWSVIGHFLFPVTTWYKKLFLMTRDCPIPRYTRMQYIISRDTWSDVLLHVIL